MARPVRLQRFAVRRILGPMPSGSSRPLLVETDAGRFVLKLLHGADGPRSLAAEWIGTSLAALIGLPTLELAALELDAALAATIVESELREAVVRGAGLCLGVRELKGAQPVRLQDLERVPDDFALPLLWLDILLQNPDRRRENPNLLQQGAATIAIDHASTLPFHHDWLIDEQAPTRDLAPPRSHLFAERAPMLAKWHPALRGRLTREALDSVCEALPAQWLTPLAFESDSRQRIAYAAYLWKRLRAMDAIWMLRTDAPRE